MKHEKRQFLQKMNIDVDLYVCLDDFEPQKIFEFNILGLKFKRRKKGKQVKEEISEGDLKRIQEQDQEFAKELSLKLENETGSKCINVSNILGYLLISGYIRTYFRALILTQFK